MSNHAAPEKLERARELRDAGLSLRAIAKLTGLHKETVRAHVQIIGRPQAMHNFHCLSRGVAPGTYVPTERNSKLKRQSRRALLARLEVEREEGLANLAAARRTFQEIEQQDPILAEIARAERRRSNDLYFRFRKPGKETEDRRSDGIYT